MVDVNNLYIHVIDILDCFVLGFSVRSSIFGNCCLLKRFFCEIISILSQAGPFVSLGPNLRTFQTKKQNGKYPVGEFCFPKRVHISPHRRYEIN